LEGYDYIDLDDEVVSYKFLEGYDAVIEPYSKMNLVILNGTQDNSTYYKFSVCEKNEPSNCESGSLGTLSKF
jgi:hypothetical protein